MKNGDTMLLLALVAGCVAVQSSPLVPFPYLAKLSDMTIVLNGAFHFVKPSSSNDVIDKAIERYTNLLAVPSSSSGAVKYCSLKVTDIDTSKPIVGSDESNQINISESGKCEISAVTTWGLLHGLETFTQLLVRDGEKNVQLPYAPVEISDMPRFAHRGLMIDTARHYLPVEKIRTVIDSLPLSKFNVLHWHTVDAESFPLKSPSQPDLVKGAWSPSSIYTMDTLAELTAYAFERGVEVVFELDVPGHAAGWVKGKPELVADCMTKYSNINNYALNPSLEDTYTTIQGLLTDIKNATGVRRMHLGGDEVVFGCWANDASIAAFMKKEGMTTNAELFTYFVTRADGIVKSLGASTIHWEEVFTDGCKVAPDTTFQVWTDSSVVSKITAANFNVIASPSNFWYLNLQENTWQVMYGYEPYSGIPTAQQKLIIGGEVALWGEFVDEVNLIPSLYPRASAVAERLWSQSYVTDQAAFKTRLEAHRCRLLARGIDSAPVAPSFCDVQYV